ncbi:helix-turn-helix protein [Flavimobilis soli]|uniref:Helix-turn-helix protein n=1 Tax=Flavimobilis soli TaxID=442709 RepID=A0A2A9EDF4_9MICO|nr:helix-turn-helix domain-containing protein [Flavimobilis soli]PFG36250.1 helix-turn-helix protein [Flavimobilis soli]
MRTKVVTDLDTLRAVTHPLRMRILGTLRLEGPATASELARALGESSGSTSYHLRQLERYGYVVDDVPDGDDDRPASRRERRWRAAHQQTELPAELWSGEGGREAHAQLAARQTEHLRRGIAARIETTDPADPAYEHSDYLVHLDREGAQAMLAELREVVLRYTGRGGELPISVHLLALPATT